jgi:hypothetical protein
LSSFPPFLSPSTHSLFSPPREEEEEEKKEEEEEKTGLD